jgi:hypothetical protein
MQYGKIWGLARHAEMVALVIIHIWPQPGYPTSTLQAKGSLIYLGDGTARQIPVAAKLALCACRCKTRTRGFLPSLKLDLNP